MNDFRAVIAIFISVVSSYFIIDLFLHGFSWPLLAASIFGFLLVHILWPKNRSGESAWYDALEIIFDLPYRAMALCIRGLGKLLSKGGDSAGFDL